MKSTIDFSVMLAEAFTSAARATNAYLQDHPNDWYPCGFAWVKIKPARGPLVTYLKKQKIGRTDDFGGGYVIYNPSQNPTQSMEAKLAGARAFAKVFNDSGIPIKVESRID